ncbi:MAG: nitroreductase family protein [Candidatus Binatia bacterium]
MELQEAIRTAGACRYYLPEPVGDDALRRVLDAARFAPSGGNRQPLRFVVVRNPATKRQLKEWYLVYWRGYLEGIRKGQVRVGGVPRLVEHADHFANHLDEIPVLVVACARLADVHPTDHQLGRLSVVGGASIYPAIQNLLLACREEGLGACLTTLLCFEEAKVKELLAIPDDIATVAMIPIGHPRKPPKRLARRPLSEIAFLERYGEPLPA